MPHANALLREQSYTCTLNYRRSSHLPQSSFSEPRPHGERQEEEPCRDGDDGRAGCHVGVIGENQPGDAGKESDQDRDGMVALDAARDISRRSGGQY